jgi:hypothetical protein
VAVRQFAKRHSEKLAVLLRGLISIAVLLELKSLVVKTLERRAICLRGGRCWNSRRSRLRGGSRTKHRENAGEDKSDHRETGAPAWHPELPSSIEQMTSLFHN